MSGPLWKKNRWESRKWREAARGQDCTMNLPGCNGNPETTVLAHRNGAGMGTKASDHDAADMCSSCHSSFDGATDIDFDSYEMAERFEIGRLKTIINRLERGIVK